MARADSCTMWASVNAFRDFAGTYREMSFTEFIGPEPANAAEEAVLEQVAGALIPAFRTRTKAEIRAGTQTAGRGPNYGPRPAIYDLRSTNNYRLSTIDGALAPANFAAFFPYFLMNSSVLLRAICSREFGTSGGWPVTTSNVRSEASVASPFMASRS